jgi:integrase
MVRTRETWGVMKLTEKSVAKLPPPAKGYIIHYDNNDDGDNKKPVAGFGVRTTASGAKSFIFNYRFKGRSVRITIGKFGKWTAHAAKNRARELGQLVDSGRDPMAERNAERGAPLMSDLFDRYLIEHALRHKKLSSVAEDWGLIHGGKFRYDQKTKTLGKADAPFGGTIGRFFAKMQVDAVEHDDVLRFHGSLHSTPYRANRALALLSKAMNLAEVWKRPNSKQSLRPLNSNPCRHVKKYEEKERSRYLKHDELTALDKALGGADPMVAGAIRLAAYTGCRIGEVLGFHWDRIDTRAGVATLDDAKAGARTVQLSTPALAVLAELGTEEGPVFGDLTYSKLDKKWRRIRKDAGLKDVPGGTRIHDLRHTLGTYAGKSGANAFIVKDLLGHKTLAMTGRYVGQFDDPVKAASEAVSRQIAAAFKGKKAKLSDHPTKKTARR